MQNLLGYYTRNVADPNLDAELVRATYFNASGGNADRDLEAPMKAAIIAGYSHSPGYDVPKYYCATGNCTWTNTKTLGVCSRCADVTSYLNTSCHSVNDTSTKMRVSQRCIYKLPNKCALDTLPHPDTTVNAVTFTQAIPIILKHYTTTLAIFHAIYGSSHQSSDYQSALSNHTQVYATECVLVPCVQVFNSSVGSSVHKSSAPGSVFFNDKIVAEYDEGKFSQDFAIINGSVTDTHNSGVWLRPKDELFGKESYHLSLGAYGQISNYITKITPGKVELRAGSGLVHYINTFISSYGKEAGDLSDGLFLQQVFGLHPKFICDPRLHHNPGESLRVVCVLENMARAMTTYMRNVPDSRVYQYTQNIYSELSQLYNPRQITVGTTLASKTYIAIKWGWLVLPLALWVLALIMLCGTIWKTRMAGIREEERERIELHDMTAYGLERKAETLKVRLHVTEQEAKLVPS